MQPKQIIQQQNQITPERFKELCLISTCFNDEETKQINDLINCLFNPELNTLNNIATVTQYVTGGLEYDDFKSKIKRYDNSTVCGLVWNTHYVAYRCRTCAISPCMSICAECFKNSNHEGHDFNMFRSGAGGACDCGDEDVMNKRGFCKFHGPDREAAPEAPSELIKCSEVLLPNLVYRLLQYFRSVFKEDHDFSNPNELISDAQAYLDFLNDLCCLGTTMRKVIVNCMLNEEFYTKKIKEEKNDDQESHNTQHDEFDTNSKLYLHKTFLENLTDINRNLRIPDEFRQVILKPKYVNVLNEYLYWCIKYEFPENLVKFLLILLPDNVYKIEFTRSFVTHYMYITNKILNSDSENLASRVVHISVQLFSSELITNKALQEYTLLPIFMSTLYNMINAQNMLKLSQIQDNKQSQVTFSMLTGGGVTSTNTTTSLSRHYVADADNKIFHDNLYWPIINDLVNLLSHKTVAIRFLTDQHIFDTWLYLINCFQSMNLNERQLFSHIQYDQPTYFSSFSAELEFCSSITWSFIQHLTSEQTLDITLNSIKLIEKCLFRWFMIIGTLTTNLNAIIRPNPNQLTFHLPLNRFYSIFIYNALYKQNAKFDKNLLQHLNDLNLINLLAYPLQTQIGYYEIHANMWIRNGLQMKGQAMTYVQNHFSSSFNDADLFLLQVIMIKFCNYDLLLRVLLERFHLSDYFKLNVNLTGTPITPIKNISSSSSTTSMSPITSFLSAAGPNILSGLSSVAIAAARSSINTNENRLIKINGRYDFITPDSNQYYALLNGFLTLLTQLICIKPNMELQNTMLTRTEIINLLCVADRTYSQIEENLPDICSLSTSKKDTEFIVKEVADYKQPSFEIHTKGLKQGYYVPKEFVWLNEYDPLHVLLRSVKQREYQESFDRYCDFIKLKNLNKNLLTNKLWPPLRLPKYDYENVNCINNELLLKKLNVLETKTLHGFLFSLLYKHFYEQTLPERCFYFIIYIIELALYKKQLANETVNGDTLDLDCSNDSMDDDVIYKETNYEEWFKTNNILDNLCKEIPYITNDDDQISSNGENTENNNETTSSSNNNSGNNNNNNRNKTSLSLFSSNINSSDESSNDSNKYETNNINTSKNKTKKVTAIGESMLSLIVKIMHKYQKKESNQATTSNEDKNATQDQATTSAKAANEPEATIQVPLFEFKSEINESRIGDEYYFLSNLLNKAALLSVKCKKTIQKSLEKINTKSGVTTNDNEDEAKRKKAKAKARQMKLMAQMKSNQQEFLSNARNDDNFIYEDENEEDINLKQKSYDCCICRVSSVPSPERPIGIVALLQSTSGIVLFLACFICLLKNSS